VRAQFLELEGAREIGQNKPRSQIEARVLTSAIMAVDRAADLHDQKTARLVEFAEMVGI